MRAARPLRGLLGAATFVLAVAAGAGFVALAAAPAAHAAPFVDVKYDLGDSTAFSTILALGVTTEIPPHGTISGTQTIRYASDSASGLATGAAELLTFNLDVHATIGGYGYDQYGNRYFQTLNTSDLHFEFLGLTTNAGAGQRLSGGTITPLGASGIFRVTGKLHCYRLCSALKLYATTTATLVPQRFTAPLPVLTGAVGQSHTVQGTATGVRFYAKHYDVGLGTGGVQIGVTGTTVVVGREIQRTPVPEPSTLPLLAGGLVGLGLAGAAWRRRARG